MAAIHSGGASVPSSHFDRFVIHSDSDDLSDDSHQQQHESDFGSLESEMIPNMSSDLDGILGYTHEADGVIRPHDLEIEVLPPHSLPPQDLVPCPPILSDLPGDFQGITGDLQSSLSSSLVVSVPNSPRSDLGGVIGYAVDIMGVWHPFDLEPPGHDQFLLTLPSQATSHLLESGLATFLPVQCPHTGGTITIRVDHGLLSFVDTIHPLLTLAEWKKANDLSKRDQYWQGAMLDPSICLERRAATSLTVTLIPRMWHEGEQPVIRSFQQCRESAVWSLAEISCWHPHRQLLSQLCWAGQS
eukprot:6457393-Amphidinium_carterae.1